MPNPISGMITVVVGGVTLALDNMGNQYATPLLKPRTGSPSQTWVYYPDSLQLQVTNFPNVNNGWVGLRSDTLQIDVEWSNSTMYWTYTGGNLQAANNQYLVPTADGTSVVLSATPGPHWTLGVTQPPLQAIPVAMFGISNPNTPVTADDPWQLTGAAAYWGTLLQKAGPVIDMPQGVGINPNYNGDAYVWATPGAPQGPMNSGPNRAWMVSIGLNMPQGPTLTAAAAPGLALYDANAPMDSMWANAAMSARYRTNAAGLDVNGVWAYTNQPQMTDMLYIRPGWEMTGSWYTWASGAPGQVSTWAADFAACFRRCVQICRDVCSHPDQNGKTTQVVAIFNPNGDYNTPAGINLDTFYPGNDVVDCLAIDIYDMPQWQGGFQADGVTPNLTAAQRFAQFQMPNLQAIDAYAHAHGKSVGICEWAAGDGGGDNPTFINQVAAWALAAASPVAVLGYWSGSSESGYAGDLNQHPNEKAAFIVNFGA